jgi:hypothetical protein
LSLLLIFRARQIKPPIYSGGLPEGADLSENCPPCFMVIAHDDKDRSIGMAELYIALK